MQIGLRTIYGRYLLCRCEQQKLGKTIRMISNRAPLPPPIAPSGPTESSVERVEFVKRAQMFDYWQHCTDDIIEREFERAKLILMVDKRPAVRADAFRQNPETGHWELQTAPRLAIFDCQELRQKLSPYGLEIGTLNSCLLDVWGRPQLTTPTDEHCDQNQNYDGDMIALFGTSLRLQPPPVESGILESSNRDELAAALGVRFMELRHAMLTMSADGKEGEKQREWLAKFQSTMRWFWTYLHCPTCKVPLKMRASKSSAHCGACENDFYPSLSPVAITLIRDERDEHALLVRHRGSASQVFTCVSGFCSPGETLVQTVQREVAEEVGIQCWDVRQLDGSQSWPMPGCSLMIPFIATACIDDKLEHSITELEFARWFSREQVHEALKLVEKDPLMTGSGQDPEVRRTLRYIPPPGAIAHHLIKVHNLVENLLVEYKTLARDLDSLRKLVKELDLLNSAAGEKAKQELYFTTQEHPDWIEHLKGTIDLKASENVDRLVVHHSNINSMASQFEEAAGTHNGYQFMRDDLHLVAAHLRSLSQLLYGRLLQRIRAEGGTSGTILKFENLLEPEASLNGPSKCQPNWAIQTALERLKSSPIE